VKKTQTDQKTSQQATAGSGRKHSLREILVLCLLLSLGIVFSSAFLGSNISRFSKKDTNVIALVPPEEICSEIEGGQMTALSSYETEPVLAEKTAVTLKETSSRQTSGNTSYTAGTSDEFHRELQIFDDVKTWNSETWVDLFRDSYNSTAKSENGENIIAPGTSNFYGFTIKNNGNIPMDYSVSLKVDTYLGEDETYSALPLQWRLLSGDGTAVTDWKGYNERTEVLREATLAVQKQDNYTIEWRWAFEGDGNTDEADTNMGNMAAEQSLGVNAAIYIYAEQNPNNPSEEQNPNNPSEEQNPNNPSEEQSAGSGSGSKSSGSGGIPSLGEIFGLGEIPQTGDASGIVLYLILLVLAAGGLLILFVINRRRKNDENA